jgi:FkbM family methyltransferase
VQILDYIRRLSKTSSPEPAAREPPPDAPPADPPTSRFPNPEYDPIRHAERVRRFLDADGDERLRLDYPELGPRSIVLDLGGFHGDFSLRIHGKYGATCHCFEVVPSLCDGIRAVVGANPAIFVHPFGLAGTTREEDIFFAEEGSSTLCNRAEEANRLRIRLVRAADWLQENLGDRPVDLMKVNIEGGEYELLEHLLDTGLVQRMRNIQVQFHEDVIPHATARMEAIQSRLSKTHRLTFQEVFVWDNWKLVE